MIEVTITRERSIDDGTFGRLHAEILGAVFECETLELPWRDNQRNVSCIPLGEYVCDWSHSGKFGGCYRLQDVPGRSGILIHPGNYAGDEQKNLRTNVRGCIMLGMQRSKMSGQEVILQSRHAVDLFSEFMGERSFRITIK